jgi:hypothetical protein
LAKIAENCGHNIGPRLLRKKLAVSGEDGKATISSFVKLRQNIVICQQRF